MSRPIYSLPQARPRTVTFAENVPTNPARRLIRPRAERLSLSITLAPLVSQRSLLFRVQTELGDAESYDQLSSVDSERPESKTPGSTIWSVTEDSDKVNMGAITAALSVASAYSQDSFYSSSSHDLDATKIEEGEDEEAQTPTSSFPDSRTTKALPPAPSSSEIDEDERIFPRQWLSFSMAGMGAPAQPSQSSQGPGTAANPPRRTSVHARLLGARRPTLEVPPLPQAPSIPPITSLTLDPSLDGPSADDHLPTRRRGLHSRSSNARSRDNDARRYAMALSPSSALEWELVGGMGMLSPEEANGNVLVPDEEHGQYLSFALPSPTIPSINHKLTMGLPEPRPISQLIISPPSSSAISRYSRQKLKGKSTKTRARRVSGVPAGHHRVSGGGVTSRLLKPPRTPRTPHSPVGARKYALSPNSNPARARAPRLLRIPSPGVKASTSPARESESSRLPRATQDASGSDSWDEEDEEHGAPSGEQETGGSQALPAPILQLPDARRETSTRVQFSNASHNKPAPAQPDAQRRATMMNTLFSRLSIDPKSLKRNRKTLAAVSQSNGATGHELESALPALSFSPITLDIPDVPSLHDDTPEKLAGNLPTAKDEQLSEAAGIHRMRSLRSSMPLFPLSKSSTASNSLADASHSTPSLATQLTVPNPSQTSINANDSQPPHGRKSFHPPSSFGLRPKGHKRTTSSPSLGEFRISAPITNTKLVSLEAEDVKLVASAQQERSSQKPVAKRTHRRTGSQGSKGSKALFSPPPPSPNEGQAVPPLPSIPALPPMPSFLSDGRNGTMKTIL
ncbi:hypothetical protein BKA70DRAFT_1306231 [Coprinopsis sp. MPI-PUGE-AT-0042]|nr:hypothetical protein BKA70DRAFT_1306231 [Coprinopsis sp. MPI-PUGE-AT-0042]